MNEVKRRVMEMGGRINLDLDFDLDFLLVYSAQGLINKSKKERKERK